MHSLIVSQIVAECRRRADNDCAGPNAFTIEQLEHAVLAMASELEAQREAQSSREDVTGCVDVPICNVCDMHGLCPECKAAT